jgi:GNAT superfamily N-acetyltransferase
VDIGIECARARDADDIAAMAGELLHEIMDTIGEPVFSFDFAEAKARAGELIEQGRYIVFLARAADDRRASGFISLYESYALYAEGVFGTIAELYVRVPYRAAGLGTRLLVAAGKHGRDRGWRRLEVTTPPLPEFERTLRFYERAGFAITGGRKLKVLL